MNGPSWLGSYEGQSALDICSSITKVDAEQWSYMKQACNDLIERKVKSGLIGIGVIISFGALWTSMQAIVNISIWKFLK